MNALTPVILNAEFGLLWSVRLVLRGIAIGVGLAAGMVALSLFATVGALESLMDVLKERSRIIVVSPNSTNRAASKRGLKEVLS